MHVLWLALLLLQANPLVLENEFMKVYQNTAPCAAAGPSCGDRIVVALGAIELGGQKLSRGEFKVFKAGAKYAAPTGGEYVEVTMKPDRPRGKSPKEYLPSQQNRVAYDGERFFVVLEDFPAGELHRRHSHFPRLLIPLNAARNQMQMDGKPDIFMDLIPDHIGFFPEADIHTVKNVGNSSIKNIMIELKP